MADILDFDTKVSAEGRIVIPASARAALGLKAGDRVHGTVENGEMKIVNTRTLLHAVWANNHGGDAGDAVEDVRAARQADQRKVAAKWDRVDESRPDDTRSEEAISADLLVALGLTQ